MFGTVFDPKSNWHSTLYVLFGSVDPHACPVCWHHHAVPFWPNDVPLEFRAQLVNEVDAITAGLGAATVQAAPSVHVTPFTVVEAFAKLEFGIGAVIPPKYGLDVVTVGVVTPAVRFKVPL